MIYLYTSTYALTLPESLRCGRSITPRIRFEWAGLRKVRVSTEQESHLLELRPVTDSDRAEAINRAGWAYVAPHAG